MTESSEGIFLVDRWRVRREHRRAFLECYREQVLPVVRDLGGFRGSVVLSARTQDGDGPRPWDLEVFYEFENDGILDRFHGEFAERYRAAHDGRTVSDLLSELEPWVTAHDDSTMAALTW